MLCGVGHCNDAAHRGADQRELFEPEPVGKRRQISGLIGVLVRPGRRPGALAVTAHIERKDAIAMLELPGERVERLSAGRVAMNADDRRRMTLPPFEVMEREA